MESKVNYALIGFFVILLSLALVATILWLSVGTEQKKYQTYQVYIQESVSGLNRKATVKYRGVNVGYVREIALAPDRPNEVRVLLDIELGVPIKQDTLALLSTQGLTGLAHIELTGSSLTASPPVQEIGQPYPELKAKSSLLVRLDTALSRFLENFNRVEPNNLLASIENILQNLDKISSTLALRTDTIDTILSNTNRLITTLENTLASIDKTNQKFSQIAEDVSLAVNKGSKDLDYVTRQALPEITNTVRELQLLSKNLRRFVQKLERKPNLLLFGK